ncbi:helix-turn-helix domain-containing protein [Streptomyces hygroscopicus]|uniref:helix-turn-helix domain-containing protein n=1 Tax=Streptomyces hygroscopicus TaxID=1912 RepID=UPI0036B66354
MRIYRHALIKGVLTPAETARELEIEPAVVAEGLAMLYDIGLAREVDGNSGNFGVVSPDSAAEGVLGPLERAMRRKHSEIKKVKARLALYAPLYDAQFKKNAEPAALELVDDLGEVRHGIAELAGKCQEEVLTSQPGGGRRAEVLAEAVGRDERMLARGVRMRTVYQHTARFSFSTRAYVDHVTKLGAEIRTLDDQNMRLLIFDRSVAVASVRDDAHAALFVRDPNVVHFMVASFELMWANAQPFPLGWDNQEVAKIGEEIKQRIVRLLSEGLTDQVIAKRLGMSVRTCRRHIADIMARLGAESRFRAGYLLGSGGWQAVARGKDVSDSG